VPFGVALWLVGFGFETVGDAQLAAFTADSSNRRKVLDSGLWRYTDTPTISAMCASGGDYLYSRAMCGSDL
jgi:steroid 5-alpha reductase family enzyme